MQLFKQTGLDEKEIFDSSIGQSEQECNYLTTKNVSMYLTVLCSTILNVKKIELISELMSWELMSWELIWWELISWQLISRKDTFRINLKQ